MTMPRCSSHGRPDTATPFRAYEDVTRHLDGLGLFHMDMGLGRMKRALRTLGVRKLPCPVVQVVGTNGKGSTATFLQALAMAHGFRAGLYTSPHFLSPTERIHMGLRSLPEAAWPDLANRACAADPELTYFELLTLMAVLAFQDAEPDLLIFEAGLGGRYDATSAIPADMVCFTPMGLDHMEVLGPDLAAIAADKADALRPGMFAAVSAPQEPDARAALRRKAEELGIALCPSDAPEMLPSDLVNQDQRNLTRFSAEAELGLAGPHQRVNATTALTTWALLCHHQGWRSDELAVRRGLAEAFLPGRLQKIPSRDGYPAFLLDGAHNAHGMTALLAAMSSLNIQPAAVIFSCLADKHPEAIIPLLRQIAQDAPILVPTIADNPRAATGRNLANMIGQNARAVPDLRMAVHEFAGKTVSGGQNRPVLVCGSLYLLTEFFSLFPDALHNRAISL